MRAAPLQVAWRALVPVAVAGAGALVAAGAFSGSGPAALPARTADQLVADLRDVDVGGFSGTVVQKSALGLALPDDATTADGLSIASLMTGSNTIKVWYAGQQRQRIAVLDPVGESDLFRDGSNVWQWQSSSRSATFLKLPPAGADSAATAVSTTPLTPDDVARQAVGALGTGTTAETDGTATVAGRPVYRLVLRAHEATTRIGTVEISLDGATGVPLAAQIWARDQTRSAAIDVSFTHVDFGVPDDDSSTFTPPPDARVTTFDTSGSRYATNPEALLGVLSTHVIGTGWQRIVEISPPGSAQQSQATLAGQFGSLLHTVSGPWGSGKLLQSTLVDVLFLDDGQVIAGAVQPEALYRAAASS